jgi:hypothetical protein
VVTLIIGETLLYNFYFTNRAAAEGDWGILVAAPIWVELALVCIAVIFNLCCMAFGIYKMLCKKKTAEVHPDQVKEVNSSEKPFFDLNSRNKLEVEDLIDKQSEDNDHTNVNLDHSEVSSPKKRKMRVKRMSDPLRAY